MSPRRFALQWIRSTTRTLKVTIVHLPRLTPYEEVLKTAQTWCDTRIASRPEARVLDAGSGLRSYVEFPAQVHVTGIDVSQDLLDRNSRLNERINADLQEWDAPARAYDCVVCWEVLEHLENPFPLIAKLAGAVAENGLLIIGSPNPQSIKGLVTRFTPQGFHLWLYRRFFNPEASEEAGAGPYRTFMKNGGGAPAVGRAAELADLTSVYAACFESPMQAALRGRFRITGGVWQAMRLLTDVLSFGRIQADATDYVCIFERRVEPGRH